MRIRWEKDGIMCGEEMQPDLYIKLGPHDIIKKGAVHSVTKGYYNYICGSDTIGDTPSSFSPDRVFYNKLSPHDFFSNYNIVPRKSSMKCITGPDGAKRQTQGDWRKNG